MQLTVQTEQLTFSFAGERPVLEAIDLQIPAGAVFGILGPNGAGKSTLMKLLLGLLPPDSGRVLLFNQPMGRDPALFGRIGVLIEEPRLYPHLSGRDNLRVFAAYRGIGAPRVEEVLAIVGMHKAAARLVRHYSTGMKQRLAISLALLGDPDLLFLDEPTNGLDPQGIAEVRRLVLELQRRYGKTILLSSHILSEIEQACTHVGILDRGRLRFQGALSELRRPAGRTLLLETDNAEAARRVLSATGRELLLLDAERLQVSIGGRVEVPALIDALRASGIAVFQARLEERRLEDYFLEMLD